MVKLAKSFLSLLANLQQFHIPCGALISWICTLPAILTHPSVNIGIAIEMNGCMSSGSLFSNSLLPRYLDSSLPFESGKSFKSSVKQADADCKNIYEKLCGIEGAWKLVLRTVASLRDCVGHARSMSVSHPLF